MLHKRRSFVHSRTLESVLGFMPACPVSAVMWWISEAFSRGWISRGATVFGGGQGTVCVPMIAGLTERQADV